MGSIHQHGVNWRGVTVFNLFRQVVKLFGGEHHVTCAAKDHSPGSVALHNGSVNAIVRTKHKKCGRCREDFGGGRGRHGFGGVFLPHNGPGGGVGHLATKLP